VLAAVGTVFATVSVVVRWTVTLATGTPSARATTSEILRATC
jgi:hypothetical protein